MSFLNRRRVLAALIPLGAALGWRTSPAQVGSGGSGITDSVGAATLVVGSVTLTRAGEQPVPVSKDALQAVPQAMPAGREATEPPSVRRTDTTKVIFVKRAPTDWA